MRKSLVFGAAFFSSLAFQGLSAGAAQAQGLVRFGPLLGANAMSCRYVGNPNVYATPYLSTTYRAGAEVGGQAEFARAHFAFQPGLRWSQQGFGVRGVYNEVVNGGAVSAVTVDADYRLNYLTVPLTVAYAFRPDGQGWQLYAGGYGSVLLGGRARSRSSSRTNGFYEAYPADQAVKAGPEDRNDGHAYFQRYDAGVQAGVGYRCRGVLVHAGYRRGLANTGVSYPYNGPDYRDGPTFHNRGFELTAAYLFEKK